MGQIWEDVQVGPVQVGYSSCLGHNGVRTDLHQAAHDGFHWPKDGTCWGGACGSG